MRDAMRNVGKKLTNLYPLWVLRYLIKTTLELELLLH